MSRNQVIKDAKDVNDLAERLAKCEKVSKCDEGVDVEGGSLAHSFHDLEESFRELLEVHFPKLMSKDLKPEEIENVLFDIGEEFRHILYHIRDPKTYRYLLDTLREDFYLK